MFSLPMHVARAAEDARREREARMWQGWAGEDDIPGWVITRAGDGSYRGDDGQAAPLTASSGPALRAIIRAVTWCRGHMETRP